MPIIEGPTAQKKSYDACIVGSGPAGLGVALPLADAGLKVLIVEAGDLEPSTAPWPSERLECEGTHADAGQIKCRALGGTSALWGGRTLPFARQDFELNGWPIKSEDLAPYEELSAVFLGAQSPGQPFLDMDAAEPFDLDAVEVLADMGSLCLWQRDRIAAQDGPDILLRATAVGLLFERDASGHTRCAGVRLRLGDSEEAADLKVPTTVLAEGGIETTRLLLAERFRSPEALGHLEALGHYYTGHLTGSIASIAFPKHVSTVNFGWRPLPGRGSARRIFRSSGGAISEGANMMFWLRNWPANDASHGSAVLSAMHLVKRALGREEAVQMSPGPGLAEALPDSSSALLHVRNLVADSVPSLPALPDVFRARFNRRRAKLDHLIPTASNTYRLSYHAEQEARADNRIELAGDVRRDVLPDISIRFDFSETDVERVLHGHTLLAKSLMPSGLAMIKYDHPPEARAAHVRLLALDGYHQTGTMRMGTSLRDSVVDRDCRVHGLRDLYLSGSAVFRSSGAQQPTHAIVATSMRLADHLASRHRNTHPITATAS